MSVEFSPGADGGSPVTGYEVECVSGDGGQAGAGSGPASPVTVEALTNGSSYVCRVRATNTVGTGAYGPDGATVALPAATVPASPTVASSSPGPGRVTVAFTPGSDGGSLITNFTAQCLSTDGGVTRSAGGAASPLAVTGLTPGKHYHCRVRAANALGIGAFSGYGATVVVNSTVPASPTVASSTPGPGRVTVAFTPGSDGGSLITNFTAQCLSTDGGVTRSAGGAASPLAVTGLSPGKHYHCRVRAANALGIGAFSGYGATVVVNSTVPASPTVASSTPGPGRVTVAFTPGSDGGSPVTNFTAQCLSTDGGVTRSAGGAASPLAVTGLTPGKHYHCHMRAANVAGLGVFGPFGITVLVL